MAKIRALAFRYRIALVALIASAALHAAVIVGSPGRADRSDEAWGPSYSASLEPGATLEMQGDAPRAAAAKPAPKRAAARPRAPPHRVALAPPPPPPPVEPPPAPEPAATEGPPPETALATPPAEKAPEPAPERVALAEPAVPLPPPAATIEPKFQVDALPERIRITYALTSSFADGRAVYQWKRDGEHYEISSEAEAIGFFTLFLEGRIRQESWGTVTTEGLRPERFIEHRPSTPDEGIEFDWSGKQITFDLGDRRTTSPLVDNTVDWLSMIFQLAHMPPKSDPFSLRVYTQRKMYQFELKVVGEEVVEIPLGKVRALHLRHQSGEQEIVDVWLGIDYHYLPVKMRYPVARNRLVVDQVATRISEN